MSEIDRFFQLLSSLPGKSYDRELDFIRDVIPTLAEILGYSEAETFYELAAGRYRADVVLTNSIDSTPWVVIELKRKQARNLGDWAYQIKNYLSAFGSRTGVVLSTEVLILVHEGQTVTFSLRDLTPHEAAHILQSISRATQPAPASGISHHESEIANLIEAAETAADNEKKGKSLEALARALIRSVPSLACKYANLQTRSSEIDIVVEYDSLRGRIQLLEESGRYILVECKNWNKPAGVAPVRDFMGKLDKCKIRLGVLFSKNGVTGVDSGADALREIQSRFDRDGVYVLVFSLEDVRRIENGKDFINKLDQKADALRFDM
ncbi:hypothetical protein FCE95_15845 [Luteimonas gilva]|uniref:Restriction endonuclease type IV Mrr domain-containing protein n=1 Tax=Luteimonas gilva TaxID=2572684 RepID=A0A4U5JJ60_9GAMM|nr:restriction endonuclease [Luteimonas gilva]TKR29600.1 hypothetical protein FCE95_15845 [Luteimonas gilva]